MSRVSATRGASSENPEAAVPKEPQPVDAVREARLAHLEASAGLLQRLAPGHESAPRPLGLSGLLTRAVLNERLQTASELAAWRAAFRDDAPYSAWLAALGDRLSGKPETCLQRLVDQGSALNKAMSRLAASEAAALTYASEVLQALCAFDAGDRATGSAAVWRADRLASTREEHHLAQASFWRAQGQQALESAVVSEMLAVVKRPSVGAYGFAFETMRNAGERDTLSVTIRRALAHYPGNVHIEAYLALIASDDFDGGPSVCEAIGRAYAIDATLAASAFNQALCLRKDGQQKEAIRVVETALLGTPNFAPLLGLLAGLYAEVGRTEDAARVWRQTLQVRRYGLSSVTHVQNRLSGDASEGAASGVSQFLIQTLVPSGSRPVVLPQFSKGEGVVP